MKFGKWMGLAILVTMVLSCVVIVAVVSLMMIITFVKLITHVERNIFANPYHFCLGTALGIEFLFT